jgi:hypothetical protein
MTSSTGTSGPSSRSSPYFPCRGYGRPDLPPGRQHPGYEIGERLLPAADCPRETFAETRNNRLLNDVTTWYATIMMAASIRRLAKMTTKRRLVLATLGLTVTVPSWLA